jgi:mRNA interferase MazF
MKHFYDIPVKNFRRGDIVFIENPNREGEMGEHVLCGNRPAVVVQNELGNVYSPNLIVAYLTSQTKRMDMKTHVLLTWYEGLQDSMIQTEQLATVGKEVVRGYITHLREEDMVRLDRALLVSLGLRVSMKVV